MEDENIKIKKPIEGKGNVYVNEIMRFLDKEVDIVYIEGQTRKEISGILLGININYMNAVIRTAEKKILIRNVATIERYRTSFLNQKGEKDAKN